MTDPRTERELLGFSNGLGLEVFSILEQGGRQEQQDCIAWRERQDATLLVLADGMGGHAGGALASKVVVDAICQEFSSRELTDTVPPTIFPGEQLLPHGWRDEMRRLLNTAQQSLCHLRESRPDLKPAPDSTCVLALITCGEVFVAHLGDSRCYRLTADTQSVRRTQDHSLAQMLVNNKELSETEVLDHPSRNKLLKSVASGADEAAYESYGGLGSGSSLLLCSDGFWEHLSDQEIIGLQLAPDARVCLVDSVDQILRRAGEHADNIAAIFVRPASLDCASARS